MERGEKNGIKIKRPKMAKLSGLIAKIQNYNSEANFDLIKRAFEFAEIAHAGQKRLSGDPVISHPLAVAEVLADYRLDSASIAAGLLHDTVEDAGVSFTELEKEFGLEIANLVKGVTNISKIKLRGSSDEEFVENLRKMILAMSKDLRVVLVKLVDRLHNMQTLRYLPEEKQKRISRETLEVYAPLSDRLGMGNMKGALEDLAFPYLYPQDFVWVSDYSRSYYKKAKDFLEKATREVHKELAKENIKAAISTRPKHLYSLWKKLLRPEYNRDISEIYDLVAMRVLVETIKDCYASLGIIHSIWRPVPKYGISDYIAVPKPNGYRSLHTRVFSLKERVLEIQIRTFEMHEEAEYGVAAHWYYSTQKNIRGTTDNQTKKGFFAPNEKLSWVKQLVAWQKEVVDSQEFMDALRFDALAERIFVFSPNGDVFDLPAGATPIDFAYGVHTDLGDQADGAKVNGKLVSLDHKLKSGDMVEIIKKTGSKPTEGWLRFVVTNQAKRKINQYLREKNRQI